MRKSEREEKIQKSHGTVNNVKGRASVFQVETQMEKTKILLNIYLGQKMVTSRWYRIPAFPK